MPGMGLVNLLNALLEYLTFISALISFKLCAVGHQKEFVGPTYALLVATCLGYAALDYNYLSWLLVLAMWHPLIIVINGPSRLRNCMRKSNGIAAHCL